MVAIYGRGFGLGASELPAIAGSSPWQTATDVWLDRMGLGSGRPDTGAMGIGRALELVLLKEAGRRLGLRLTHNAARIRHADWPDVPLWGTPDGFSAGRRELIEVKVVGHHWSDWSDGPPEYVQLQVQAQLAACRRPRRTQSAIIVALLGTDLRTYEVEPDPRAQESIPELVRSWWARHIEGELSPDPVGAGEAWAQLKATATVGQQHRIATPDEQRLGGELLVLTAEAKELERRVEDLRLKLAGLAGIHVIDGIGWRGSWSVRHTVDWRAVVEEVGVAPDVIARHEADTPTFTFRRARDQEAIA